jgi:hypothetical protein
MWGSGQDHKKEPKMHERLKSRHLKLRLYCIYNTGQTKICGLITYSLYTLYSSATVSVQSALQVCGGPWYTLGSLRYTAMNRHACYHISPS